MSIVKTEFSFLSSNGTNTIGGIKIYNSEVTPKATFVISHGMVEHYERYIDFMTYLANMGFVTYCHDHLGHKHSVQTTDDLGYMAAEYGYTYVLKDLLHTRETAKSEYPDLKLFLFGHSMGSFYARVFISKFPGKADGAIISGTGYSNSAAGLGLGLNKVLTRLKGDRYRSPMFKNLVLGSFNKKIKNPKTENDWLTRDESVVEKYNADEFCTFNFTLSGYKDLLTVNCLSNEKETFENTPDMPIFIFSGSMDPVGDYGTGVYKVFEAYKSTGHNNVRIKLYDGGRHEMLNEINRCEVYNDIYNWCKKVLEA